MSGVYVHYRCYHSSISGIDAYYSSHNPSFNSDGCLTFLSKPGSQWLHNVSCPSQPVQTTNAPIPDLLPCEPIDSVADGLSLSFAVVGVWVIAWSFTVLKRLFDAH